MQQKGLQLLKERKTRKQPTEESSEDSDSETVNSQYVLRLNNRINRNLKNSIKIQTRILTLVQNYQKLNLLTTSPEHG